MQHRFARASRICLITICASVKYPPQPNQVYKLATRNDGFPPIAFFPAIRKPSLPDAKQLRPNGV
jgi:hypothetical protein